MNKDILTYIKQNNGAELAIMQQKFGIPYKEAKVIVDKLISDGTLAYESGLRYSYIKKYDTLDEHRAELERRRAETIRKLRDGDSEEDGDEERARAERQAYIEARRQELIRRMQELMSEDDDEDSEGEENDEEEISEDELRYKALKLCIEKNVVSVSLFQRTFPIGYFRACKLVDWMESRGYVSKDVGSTSRKVLITEEELENLYSEPLLIDYKEFVDEQFKDDEDKKFAGHEKYLSEHFSDIYDNEGDNKEYDKLIKRIFNSDTKDSDAPLIDLAKHNEIAQNFVNVLSAVIAKKSAPISVEIMPAHPSWDSEDEFNKCVMGRLARLIKSDKRMGLKSAVKKAETYLEAVRDTDDYKKVEVYERLVYEIKNTSSYLYKQLKKQYFGE